MALLGLAAPSDASAQASEALVLLPRCEPRFGGTRFRRLLALELSLANVEEVEAREAAPDEGPAPEDGRLHVRIDADCEVGGRAVITVDAGPGAPSVHQVLDLSDVAPGTRARAIAVATAEQVRLQHLLAARTPDPGDEPPSARSVVSARGADVAEPGAEAEPAVGGAVAGLEAASVDAAEPPAVDEEESGVDVAGSFWLAFESRAFPELATWPLGLRVGASFSVAPLVVAFDAGAGYATGEHATGRVDLWALTFGVAIGARWQATRELGLTPSLRADVGFVSITGSPFEGRDRTSNGANVVLLASLRGDVTFAERYLVLVDAEVGPSLLANVATAGGSDDVAGTRGVAIGLRVGFGFLL